MDENPPEKCPLCHHSESVFERVSQTRTWGFSCPRCGKYYLAKLLYSKSQHLFTENVTFKLACIACERNIRHKNDTSRRFVLLNEGSYPGSAQTRFPDARIFMIDEMLDAFPDGSDIFDRSLMNISRLVKHPLETVKRSNKEWTYLMFCPEQNLDQHIECMEDMDLIRKDNYTMNESTFYIAPHGWERVSELSIVRSESQQGFVAMWFSNEIYKYFREGIKPAIEKAGYKAQRIDEKEHLNDIRDEIIAEIRRSRFLVADVTGQSSGVYFEAGFAQGLGLPVIWTVREDQIGQVHFDTRQYNHLLYKTCDELCIKLKNRIVATIGPGSISDSFR